MNYLAAAWPPNPNTFSALAEMVTHELLEGETIVQTAHSIKRITAGGVVAAVHSMPDGIGFTTTADMHLPQVVFLIDHLMEMIGRRPLGVSFNGHPLHMVPK